MHALPKQASPHALPDQASPLSNLRLLDEILATRREMAETVGCASFSDYKAVDASLAQVWQVDCCNSAQHLGTFQ